MKAMGRAIAGFVDLAATILADVVVASAEVSLIPKAMHTAEASPMAATAT
jgi:hypothetical protein